jgi:hypothetical protein
MSSIPAHFMLEIRIIQHGIARTHNNRLAREFLLARLFSPVAAEAAAIAAGPR